jgi:hypothetical protein
MRQDIQKVIDILKSICDCVDGGLEFKAILDYKQLQIDDGSAAIEHQGSQDDKNDQYNITHGPGHDRCLLHGRNRSRVFGRLHSPRLCMRFNSGAS